MTTTEKGSVGPHKYKGIFITEGVDFTIHGIRLAIGPKDTKVSNAGVSLRQDLCRYWLRIAFDHTKDAVAANEDLREAEKRGESKELAIPLEREFRASMQAVLSAAVALDAFYASVKDRFNLSEEQVTAWRKNRTARWKQMAEVFRLAFGLKPKGVKAVREHLLTISKYRDWAVHPPAHSQQPVLHSDIHRGVEWHFMAFRRHNAIVLTQMAFMLVHRLSGKMNDESPLGKYCRGLHAAVDNIAEKWIVEYPEHPVTAAQEEQKENLSCW